MTRLSSKEAAEEIQRVLGAATTVVILGQSCRMFVPWYSIWTRGWRGLLVTLMFYFLVILPAVIANIIWTVVVMQVG